MALTVRPRQATGGTGVANFQRVRGEDTWAGGLIAPAIQRIEATAQAFVDEDANRKASGALLKAQGDFMAFQDGLRERQDYDKFGSDWDGFAEKWKAENLGELNPLARAKLGDRIDQMVVRGTDQVRDRAWATQLDVSRADLLRFEEDAFRIVGQDPTGPNGKAALGTYAERIDTMEEGGFLTAEQAEAQRQGAKSRYGSVAAVSLIDKDPYEAKRQLANGGFDQYLSPEKKLQLQGAADTEIKRREAEARARQAEANALWLAGFEDELAFLESGQGVPSTNYTRDELVKRLGAEKGGKLADAHDYASAYGEKYASLSTASKEERDALLAQEAADLANPEGFKRNAAELDALRDARKAIDAALEADPAKYAIQTSPAVGAAYEEMVDAMSSPGADAEVAAKRYAAVAKAEIERLTGKPATDWLPGSYMAVVSQQFANQTEGGENAAQVVAGLQQTWGRQWEDVYGQLVRAEALPAGAVMMGSGMAEGPSARLAEALRVPMDDLEKGIAESDVSDIRDDVGEALADFRVVLSSYPGSEKLFSAAHDSVQRLALAYAREGTDPGDAVDRAYGEVIGSRYEFFGTYLVPVEYDPDAVSSGAKAVKDNLAKLADHFDVPGDIQGTSEESRRADFVSTVVSGGYWITTPDQSGLTLLNPNGWAVTVGGKPFAMTWEQLKDDELGQIERILRDMGLR